MPSFCKSVKFVPETVNLCTCIQHTTIRHVYRSVWPARKATIVNLTWVNIYAILGWVWIAPILLFLKHLLLMLYPFLFYKQAGHDWLSNHTFCSKVYTQLGWDGMGWDGMGWDGMGWDDRMSYTKLIHFPLNVLTGFITRWHTVLPRPTCLEAFGGYYCRHNPCTSGPVC